MCIVQLIKSSIALIGKQRCSSSLNLSSMYWIVKLCI